MIAWHELRAARMIPRYLANEPFRYRRDGYVQLGVSSFVPSWQIAFAHRKGLANRVIISEFSAALICRISNKPCNICRAMSKPCISTIAGHA